MNEKDIQNVTQEDSELDLRPMEHVPLEVRARGFIKGTLTFADLQGLTNEELYQLAEIGEMLYNEGKIEDAQIIFEGLVVLNPYDFYFHCGLGAIYQKKGEIDKALIEYDRAISINDSDIASLTNRAEIYISQKEFDKALNDLEKIAELDPEGKNPHTQRAKGLSLAIANVTEEAVKT
jgi:tetratricopeptide (TPR) repeat protein